MEQRNLGGLVTSAIGLGCMGLSQGYGRPTTRSRSGSSTGPSTSA